MRSPGIHIVKKIGLLALAALVSALASAPGRAQTADQAWLKYAPAGIGPPLPLKVLRLGNGALEKSAADELVHGLHSLYGEGELETKLQSRSIILGTYAEVRERFPNWRTLAEQKSGRKIHIHDDFRTPFVLTRFMAALDGFEIVPGPEEDSGSILIAAPMESGLLYGAFELLRGTIVNRTVLSSGIEIYPAMPIRWVDE